MKILGLIFLISLCVFVDSLYPIEQVQFDSGIKSGMTKEKVKELVGNPFYSPNWYSEYDYREHYRRYGFTTDVWFYMFPHKFTVWFKDGKVEEVEY